MNTRTRSGALQPGLDPYPRRPGGVPEEGEGSFIVSVDIAAWAAVVFAIVAIGVIAFQLALALGAPWGAYAMGGGSPGRFPPRLRVAALVQGALLAVAAAVVLARAHLALPQLLGVADVGIWVVVAVSFAAVVLNAISRSAGERRLWVPVAVVMLVSSLLVALGPK